MFVTDGKRELEELTGCSRSAVRFVCFYETV